MSEIINTIPVLGFQVEDGTVVIMTCETMGGTHEGDDVTCPPGSVGKVDKVVANAAGELTVTIGIHAGQSEETGEDLYIVNVFEAGDSEPRYPFVRADQAVMKILEALKGASADLHVCCQELQRDPAANPHIAAAESILSAIRGRA